MLKLTDNQVKWKAHIDAASASGQTLADYGRANGLGLKKLYAYSRAIQKKLDKPATKPTFVRVQRPAPTAAGGVRIELANGVRVNLAAPADLGPLLVQLAKLP